MYKPNFCAECGGRIVRLRWRVWTSRSFCVGCDKRLRKPRLLLWWAAACLALVGAGFVGGRAMRPAAPPLVIERSALNSPTLAAQTSPPGNKETAVAPYDSNARADGADGTLAERPTDPVEVVSVCGARTKKGTPCSRRVRGTGRCWQHRGKPAMLPASKLLVQD